MNLLVNNLQEKEAVTLFNKIKTPNIRIYNLMIDLYRKLNQPNEAVSYFILMINNDIDPTLSTINRLIDAFARNSDEMNAISWFNMMNYYKLEPNSSSYTIIINMYARLTLPYGNAKRNEYAIMNVSYWFNRMLHSTTPVVIKPLNCIMHMFARLGRINDVLAWYHIMKYNFFITPDLFTYTIIIGMYSKLNKPELALMWYNEKSNPDIVMSNTIIDMYGKLGDTFNAMEIYRSISDPDIFTFTTLIDMWGKMGNPDEVENLYNTMIERGIKPNVNTHTVMIRGSTWENVLYHNDILEKNESLTNTSISVFIDSCGFNNQLQVAIDFWDRITMNYYHLFNANTYTSMIEACGRCGEYEKGTEILERFENSPFYQSSTQDELNKLYTTYATQITY